MMQAQTSIRTPDTTTTLSLARILSAASAHSSIFTGKERDTESGNDYFGARYYASSMGRFMSPDWSAKVTPVPYAKLSDPQSLNLYAYVGNNPMTRFDPDGHFDCTGKNAQGAGCQYIANWNKEHGIDPSAKKSNAPGVPVKLPNGKTVPDSHSPTGVMMAPSSSVSDVAAAGKKAGQDAAAGGLPLKSRCQSGIRRNTRKSCRHGRAI
jgi:RHS repeat-associated protein